jgi:hypothetical protein
MRNLQAINRHVVLALPRYLALTLLKTLQWLQGQTACLYLSIQLLAFQVRRHILAGHITVTMQSMKIQFRKIILDTYLEHIYV